MKQLSANEINGDFIHHLVVQDMNLMREKPQDSQRSRFMRIRAMEHPDYSGVNVYDFYDATRYQGNIVEPLSLEEAKRRAQHFPKPVRFLLSICSDMGEAVMASQMGFDGSGKIGVPMGRPVQGVTEVNLFDFGNSFKLPNIASQHVSRFVTLTGSRPDSSVTPYALDSFFHQMLRQLPEAE